jgi:regulatory protein
MFSAQGAARNDENSVAAALRCVYQMLRYGDRSEREVRRRLHEKQFTSSVIDEVIARLLHTELLDDRRLADQLKRRASEQKLLGKNGVKAFLQKRGIGRELINSVSDSFDDREIAMRFVEKSLKRMHGLEDVMAQKRIWAMLSRRGFSADAIRYAMSAHFQRRNL